MASPDVSVEDAKGMIVDMMNSLVEEMVSSFDVTPLQTEDGSKLSDQIQQMLDEGATINGTATVNADGTMTENVTVVNGESTVVVDMSFDGTAFNYVVTELSLIHIQMCIRDRNNPMVGMTVAVAVSIEEAAKAGKF